MAAQRTGFTRPGKLAGERCYDIRQRAAHGDYCAGQYAIARRQRHGVDGLAVAAGLHDFLAGLRAPDADDAAPADGDELAVRREGDVAVAAADLVDFIGRFCDGRCRVAVLDQLQPCADL